MTKPDKDIEDIQDIESDAGFDSELEEIKDGDVFRLLSMRWKVAALSKHFLQAKALKVSGFKITIPLWFAPDLDWIPKESKLAKFEDSVKKILPEPLLDEVVIEAKRVYGEK